MVKFLVSPFVLPRYIETEPYESCVQTIDSAGQFLGDEGPGLTTIL